MSKERRLGRGLAALLSTTTDTPPQQAPPQQQAPPIQAAPPVQQAVAGQQQSTGEPPRSEPPQPPENQGQGRMILVPIDQIDNNPFQPRRGFDDAEIESLAASLEEHDMLQPVIVRRVGERWQLISGERRLRAADRAGWTQLPARVRDVDDRMMAELAIVENLQRKDLNPIEKAASFQNYIRQHGCTQEELAGRLKIDRSTIANILRLLELPEPVKQALTEGRISAGHARALLPLGEEPDQIEFCNRIAEEGLSVRETERQVQEKIHAEDAEPLDIINLADRTGQTRRRAEQHSALEQELRVALGTKVDLRQGKRGRGRIVLHFSNPDEFDRLRAILTGHDQGHPQTDVG